MNTVKVTLRFVGDNVNPQHITDVTGLKPSSFTVKGAPVEKHPERRHPTNYWGIDSNVPSNEPLTAHLSQLLGLLEAHVGAIYQLKNEGHEPNFFCSLFYTSDSGYIRLDPEPLQRVAQLGASIDIHVYKE